MLDLCKVSDKLTMWEQLLAVLSSREDQFAHFGALLDGIDEIFYFE